MKTIEEINEIAPYHSCEWQEGYGIWQSGFMEGQKVGATEQKAIDIDRACEWLKNNLGYYNRNEVHIGKSYEQCVTDDFRKAMEE